MYETVQTRLKNGDTAWFDPVTEILEILYYNRKTLFGSFSF